MAKGTRKALARLEKMLRSDGALCVTFVNTSSPRRQTLATDGDLLRWGVEVGALSAAEAGDFAALNAELRSALAARELDARPGICDWTWGERDDDLDRMLWPVLYSAGELLASPEARKVRQCAAHGCGLLFVARGGGRPRKWCSGGCGNRASSRRHYHRKVKPLRLKIERQMRAEERRRREEKKRLRGEQMRRFEERARRREEEKRRLEKEERRSRDPGAP